MQSQLERGIGEEVGLGVSGWVGGLVGEGVVERMHMHSNDVGGAVGGLVGGIGEAVGLGVAATVGWSVEGAFLINFLRLCLPLSFLLSPPLSRLRRLALHAQLFKSDNKQGSELSEHVPENSRIGDPVGLEVGPRLGALEGVEVGLDVPESEHPDVLDTSAYT